MNLVSANGLVEFAAKSRADKKRQEEELYNARVEQIDRNAADYLPVIFRQAANEGLFHVDSAVVISGNITDSAWTLFKRMFLSNESAPQGLDEFCRVSGIVQNHTVIQNVCHKHCSVRYSMAMSRNKPCEPDCVLKPVTRYHFSWRRPLDGTLSQELFDIALNYNEKNEAAFQQDFINQVFNGRFDFGTMQYDTNSLTIENEQKYVKAGWRFIKNPGKWIAFPPEQQIGSLRVYQ